MANMNSYFREDLTGSFSHGQSSKAEAYIAKDFNRSGNENKTKDTFL